jgi:hypothetical protein
MHDGITRWQAEAIQFGQLVWIVEEAGEHGFEVREIVAVMTDENSVIGTRRTYTEKQSLVAVRFKDVYIDKDAATAAARSEHRWLILSLERRLTAAKRTWNRRYAETDSETFDVRHEDPL